MLATRAGVLPCRTWCALLACVAFPLLSSAAEPATAPTTAPPTLKPVSVVTLPPSESGGIALAADGRSVYHVEQVHHVNVWALLAFRWPEWSLALGCAGAAAVGVALWRRARRRRGWESGEPYCRRCGYRLSGITASRCPECGRDITPARARVVAGPRWSASRKALVRAGVLVTACAAAYFPIRFAVVRESLGLHPTAGRFLWDSRPLYRFASANDLKWALRHAEQVSVIVRRDVRTGAHVGEFEGHFQGPRRGGPLQLSPGGMTVWAEDDAGLRSWDVRTGRPGRTLPWPGGGRGAGFHFFAVGSEAVMAWSSGVGEPGTEVIAAWDLSTGQPEPVPPELQLKTTLIAPLPDGVRVLARPPEGSDHEYNDIRVLDRRTRRPVPPGVIHNPLDLDSPMLSVNPQISRDGKRIFPASSHGARWPSKGRLVRGWSLETGQPLRPVGPFYGDDLVMVGTVPMHNGRRILTWKENNHQAKPSSYLQIDDVDQARTVAVLNLSPHAPERFQGVMLSGDERTLAVLHEVRGRKRGVARSFSVFDLSSLPPPE